MLFLNANGVLKYDKSKLDLLERLCNQLNIFTIVLIGDCKNGWTFDYDACSNRVKALLFDLHNRGISVIGKTLSLNSRDEEIMNFLEMHGIYSEYLIIDCDESAYKDKLKNCYFVDDFSEEELRVLF